MQKALEPPNPAICGGPCAWRTTFPQAWQHSSLMWRTTLRRKKLFKSPHIFLEPFTKYLLWPPAVGEQGAQSLCFTHNKDLGIDLYCIAGMREVVARMRRPLPPPGCSTVALLDWQILQSKGLLEKARSHQAQLAKAS